jgi:hypothetical protein
MRYAGAAVGGAGAGALVVGMSVAVGVGSGTDVVGAGVDEVEDAAADVVVGVSIAPAPPTLGPHALSSSAPAASAVTRPTPALIPSPCSTCTSELTAVR